MKLPTARGIRVEILVSGGMRKEYFVGQTRDTQKNSLNEEVL